MAVARIGTRTLDSGRFGAKSATLDFLAARHRVPEAFAIAADASDDDVRRLVPAAYRELGGGAVAVRSSAVGEDSRDASFAGQHETILGVRGADAVVDAVFAVRASAMSERAAAYRKEKGIAGVPRVGVLVQRMVPATAAVIAFTADPVTGARDEVVVNACRGLGDAMASGEVTPDVYRVRKSDLAVAGSGVLSNEQARAAAELAIALERESRHPVDVEAAFEGDTLFLLQSRPITTLGEDLEIAWPCPEDSEITWRREDAHHAGASLPLAIDYARYGAGVGMARRNEAWGAPVVSRMEEFNGRVYVGVRTVASPDELARIQQMVAERRVAHSRALATKWGDKYFPAIGRHVEAIRALDPGSGSSEEVAQALEALVRRIGDVWEIHMLTTGGAYPLMDELASTYERFTGRPGFESFALTAGHAGTLQQMRRDLFELTETTRALPDVARAIADGVETPAVLREFDGGQRFVAALDRVIVQHGHLGQLYEELDAPAWRDDPRLLVREVRRALELPPSDPQGHVTRALAEGEAVAARVRETLAERPDDLAAFEELLAVARVVGPLTEEHNYWIDRQVQAEVRRAALRFGERMVRDGTTARAEDVFHFYVAEIADALRRPRDLRAFVAERERRHERHKRWRAPETIGKAPPPGVLPGLGSAPSARVDLLHVVRQDEKGVLKGVPASSGTGRGRARLVHGPEEFAKVRSGDVLVCRSSNVSWVPLFGKVAAVVTEVGGSLSHAAVVAREVGVPCVVATGVALSELRDGEMVEVDGAAGTVRRIQEGVEVG